MLRKRPPRRARAESLRHVEVRCPPAVRTVEVPGLLLAVPDALLFADDVNGAGLCWV